MHAFNASRRWPAMREFQPSRERVRRCNQRSRFQTGFLQGNALEPRALPALKARPGAPSRPPETTNRLLPWKEPSLARALARQGDRKDSHSKASRFRCSCEFFSLPQNHSLQIYFSRLPHPLHPPASHQQSLVLSSPLTSFGISKSRKNGQQGGYEGAGHAGMLSASKFPRSVNKRPPPTSPPCATPSPWSIGTMARTLQTPFV